jgi:transcriptional regulator GlxA family with amidase domain
MKTITILVPETAVPSTIDGARYMFTTVNRFYTEAGRPVPFKVQLVGSKKKVHLDQGLLTVHPELILNEVVTTDLIIIPAIGPQIAEALHANKDMIPWIIAQYKEGSEVASFCIGAFLLASTGLLNGKTCSTHWMFANEFKKMFPEVTLLDDKVLTDQNGIYTSGGANLFWNLLLYLVEKYTNKEIAILAAKFFLLDMGKDSQSPFMIFRGQREHSDEQILMVQEFLEKNFEARITVDHLSDKFGIGRRTLERRFKKATNNTVLEYLQRIKVEAAKQQLERGRKTVNEVMYEVGYSDTKAFRDVFRKHTAMSPLDYRKKYN